MKKILLLCFISIFQLNAQELEWARYIHHQRIDQFREMVYVPSATSPYLVTYMEHTSPPGGGGGGNPTQSHFMYAYDTAGSQLWSYQTRLAPIAILSTEDNKFWIVTYGVDSVNVRNTWLSSNLPYSTHGSIFFIEVNRAGQVLSHFVWEYPKEISWYIEDVIFDRNGDFLITGKIHPNQLQDDSISFGGSNIFLPGDKWIQYVGRGSSGGTQLGIVTMESERSGAPVIVQHLAQNTHTGDILLAGRSKDSLTIGNDIVYSTHPYRELMLLRFDENLQYLDGRTYPSSSYGSIPKDLVYNELNQHFYVTGTLGDQLSLLNPDVPVQGHQNTAGNTYVAEFDSLKLLQGIYLIPQDNSAYFRGVVVSDLLFDADTNIRLVANVVDQSFACGDSIIQLSPNSSAGTDYEMVFLNLHHQDLSVIKWKSTEGHGHAYSYAACYDTAGSTLFTAGHYNGHFIYDQTALNSVAGESDALILKLRDDTTSNTSPISMAELPMASVLEIYPNPANDILHIKSIEPLLKVELMGVTGSREREFNVGDHYSLAGIKPGMYLIRVETSEAVYFEKLIIE